MWDYFEQFWNGIRNGHRPTLGEYYRAKTAENAQRIIRPLADRLKVRFEELEKLVAEIAIAEAKEKRSIE